MMTLQQLSAEHETIPTTTSWYLAELGEARGRQELFIKQSPQKLKVLREHALIESAVSSNRIEGVEVEKSRINTLIFGKPLLRDRNEEEVRGYREALKRIHEQGANLTISEKTILELHRLCRGEIWDSGKYKEKNGDIIERQANGRTRIRFRTVPAAEAQAFVQELIGYGNHPLKNAGRSHSLPWLLSTLISYASILSVTATAGCRACCFSSSAISLDMKSAAT